MSVYSLLQKRAETSIRFGVQKFTSTSQKKNSTRLFDCVSLHNLPFLPIQRPVNILQAERVDTMPLVSLRHALSLKNMAQMSIASVAHDLNSTHTKRAICLRLNRSLVALIKCRPATSRLELGLRRVERVSARAALEMALLRVETVVLASSRVLSTFLAEDVVLLPVENLPPVILGHRPRALLGGQLSGGGSHSETGEGSA